MIQNTLSLQTLASQAENTQGADSCDWLEALIVKASIEYRYEMEDIGNGNDELNILEIVKAVKTGQTSFKRRLRQCDDQSQNDINKYI